MNVKLIGKNGQIYVGKDRSSDCFTSHSMPNGDVLLQLIPNNELWLHEPSMCEKIAKADKWMKENPPKSTTNLDDI